MTLEKQIKFLENELNMKNFASIDNVLDISKSMHKYRKVTRDQLRQALNSPYEYSEILQDVSKALKVTGGTYTRILNLVSYMHTFDHYISPNDTTRFSTSEKINKSFINAATELEKYNIKSIAPWILEQVLENGELYLYKVEDSSSIMFQKFPPQFCTITSRREGILRFGINLKKITQKNVVAFPKEVQLIYKKYSDKKIQDADLIDKKYYELSDKAVAFNSTLDATKGIPVFCFLFDDLMELQDVKDLKSNSNIVENIKLIHQKVPFGKDGDPLIALDLLNAYHAILKSHLPPNTNIHTSPLDIETYTLSDGTSKIKDYVKDATDAIYDGAGTNRALFNADKINTESVASGIVADSLITSMIISQFTEWINYEMKINKKMNQWKIYFIGTTHFNKYKVSKQLREDMAFGGSRFAFQASTEKTPLQTINTLRAEQLIGIDNLMVPQATSYTQSSNSKGRPTVEENGGQEDGNGNTGDRGDQNG